jgi:uncharacterized protein YoxC
MDSDDLGIGVVGGACLMSSDWQENLDNIILSLASIQGDIEKIPTSRSSILNDTRRLLRSMNYEILQLKALLEYIEDLGFQETND